MTQMKLLIVEWVDAASDGDPWSSMKEIVKGKLAACRSVGWIVKETDEFIHLVPHMATYTDNNEDDEGFGGITIPICNITSIQEVVE